MLAFRCRKGQEVLLRFFAENRARTSYKLFETRAGVRIEVGDDPDDDHTGTFVVDPPTADMPAAKNLLLEVEPAAIGGGQVPIAVIAEQGEVELEPVEEAERLAHGFLLGTAESGVPIKFQMRLLFVVPQ